MEAWEKKRDRAFELAREAARSGELGAVLSATVATVRAAGELLKTRFDPTKRAPRTRAGLVQAIYDNDAASLGILREPLQRARPKAGWVDDELEGGRLPDGEWWIVDPAEGNINHVQGLTEWGVSATLIRDNVPVLTAVYEPIADRTFTALRGAGVAFANGVPMRPSSKTELEAAMLTTGQAKPGEDTDTYQRMSTSVRAMLSSALLVRMVVPATFQLVEVAAGRLDGFWQHSNVRSGLAAGALLVSEAGGVVTELNGAPWTVASQDFLASAPRIHAEALKVLQSAKAQNGGV